MPAANSGGQAEQAAAKYLHEKGYEIINQNWRTRSCEIDIVAKKDEHIYFIEVKYRRLISWGAGLEYITPKKIKQMKFAAEQWISANQPFDSYHLSAIEVSGEQFAVTEFLLDLQ